MALPGLQEVFCRSHYAILQEYVSHALNDWMLLMRCVARRVLTIGGEIVYVIQFGI